MGLFDKWFEQTEDEHAEPVEDVSEIDGLRSMVYKAKMPSKVESVALKEIDKLLKTNSSLTEYSIGVNYIDYLAGLPWNIITDDYLDIERSKTILDEEHYGLEDVKERILEYLAVRIMRSSFNQKILVIDDDEISLKNLEYALTSDGYVVKAVNSGVAGLKVLENNKFDVIVTDLRMKMVDGIKVLEKAKELDPTVEVIIISGQATESSDVEAIKKGSCHFLSLQKSIARCLGRKFIRISLAGMKDEAEIRGHRRSYAGALPGRIIQEIRRAGSKNPLVMLDEIDKIGQDFKGDPASALLEVLDPSQNKHFIDHYLDVPFDLSRVMFIATANTIDPIPAPLLDRLELLTLAGYSDEEKEQIAFDFLIPREIEEAGLTSQPPLFSAESVQYIIREYTREAGLRNLQRQIAAICRKTARVILSHRSEGHSLQITPALVEEYLGPRKYFFEHAEEKGRIGVATGLALTESGGRIIFVEAAIMTGKEQLTLTGSLGEVMKESAQAALSYIRSNAALFKVPEQFFEGHDIHIHIPAGSIPKDGPSAGLTIAIALLSLLTKRSVKKDVALTGELTLSGRILPVGGIREKILAARHAGINRVVIPLFNEPELKTIPSHVIDKVEIIPADDVAELIDLVLN